MTVAWYSWDGSRCYGRIYSCYWRRERRSYAILAVARTTASGESMIHEKRTNERERTLQRVRRVGRGRSTSGRCTVCCDPVFSAGAIRFRSLSAAVFLFSFLPRDSYSIIRQRLHIFRISPRPYISHNSLSSPFDRYSTLSGTGKR